MQTSGEVPTSVEFSTVFAAERRELNRRRGADRPPLREPAGSDEGEAPTGLALSGGGIRSAATCLGAIQALRAAGRLGSFDYLSSVSGGGYTGACLSASMSEAGGRLYPFGDDVRDSDVVAHIRNYSNYLLPRSRSAIRNWSEAAVILLRGLLANAVCVLAFLLVAVAVTALAFPVRDLLEPNFIPRLVTGEQMPIPFLVPALLGGLLAFLLVLWAMLRSVPALDRATSDTSSTILAVSYVLLILLALILLIDLQPLAIEWLSRFEGIPLSTEKLAAIPGGLIAFVGAISALASSLGKFLQTSRRSRGFLTLGLRLATRAALIVAALILPLLIWASYILLCLRVIPDRQMGQGVNVPFLPDSRFWMLVFAGIVCWAVMLCLRSNGYSLHRLYRDRLSKAFLVIADRQLEAPEHSSRKLRKGARRLGDLPPLDEIRLSTLKSSGGPYPLINAALNVQGSLEANKRGRNAEFFTFTPDFVGSDLTRYAPTPSMEQLDSRLDLASAMAISGAAASANMGGRTIRILSPTLSLLNVRLGYYLKNPFYVGEPDTWANRVRRYFQERSDRFYLFIEMFNGLTERRRNIYLTDGGHIENLGIYALLKRRCGLIVAIDAEADPELGCESLLKLERHARIDLGVRITLPWEEIARHSRAISEAIPAHAAPCDRGPHCAIGRIFYPDGETGLLVYVKSSLSGDEKDYILDYAERNPAFPHETTGDQFFSEEQFEMYRALGFHMMNGLLGQDRISFVKDGLGGFPDEAAARNAFYALLPEMLARPATSKPDPVAGPAEAS